MMRRFRSSWGGSFRKLVLVYFFGRTKGFFRYSRFRWNTFTYRRIWLFWRTFSGGGSFSFQYPRIQNYHTVGWIRRRIYIMNRMFILCVSIRTIGTWIFAAKFGRILTCGTRTVMGTTIRRLVFHLGLDIWRIPNNIGWTFSRTTWSLCFSIGNRVGKQYALKRII